MSGPAMGAMTPEGRLKMLTEKLNLAEDQQAKLKPILEDQSKQMKAVHDDASLAPADKQAKMKELHESSVEKINAVLGYQPGAAWRDELNWGAKLNGAKVAPALVLFPRPAPPAKP